MTSGAQEDPEPSALQSEALCRFFKNDQFAERTGIELLSVSEGSARAKMVLHPHHWNSIGIAQGGAIFTLADLAFAAASNSRGRVAVAINVSISFLKAAKTGSLWAEAKEVAKSFKLASYTVEVKDDNGDLVAIFQGMVYRKKDLISLG